MLNYAWNYAKMLQKFKKLLNQPLFFIKTTTILIRKGVGSVIYQQELLLLLIN